MDEDMGDLLVAWLGGDVPEERRARVLARLASDPEFRAAVAEELRLLGMLKVLRGSAPRWLRLEDELGWSADEAGPADLGDAVAAELASLPAHQPAPAPGRAFEWRGALAAALLLAVVGAAAWWFVWPAPRAPQAPEQAVALVVRLDGPGWEGEGPAEGEMVQVGRLQLRGGSATLAFFNGVTLHLEGPAELDIQGPNRVSCLRGRARIDAPPDSPGFTAQVPGASVNGPAAEFALTVEDGNSRVMVFEGQADVAQLGPNGQPVRSETLTTGESARLDAEAGLVRAHEGVGEFAGPIPHFQPRLVLAPGYAADVMASRPSSYWRFEEAVEGVVRNEVRGGPALRLIGSAAPGEPFRGNRGLNLPPPTEWEQHGAMSERAWAPEGVDYAAECWAQPRAVRQAAVLGLVRDNGAARLRQYGVLLELTGKPALFRHPEQTVRALHRQGVAQVRGTNLFATTNYLPYGWLHLVAQRSGGRFELHVNGKLAAVTAAQGQSPLHPSRVLLGALYASRDASSASDRPFVGVIDEAAVYTHALRPEEIARRASMGSSVRAPD